jgi:homocitrate synthase NifV
MRKEVTIIDTTLREGEQTPGLLFSLAEKKRIVDGLASIGVQEVELGVASRHQPCVGRLIEYCRKNHPRLKLSMWSRCLEDDISVAARLRPDCLALSVPVSDIHLHKRLGKDRTWALTAMRSGITSARQKGLDVAIGFEDATRSEERFLAEMVREAQQLGASRIRLADTVGIASPGDITRMIVGLGKQFAGGLFAVHTHNDFGMATANAIAAIEAGAAFVDTVALGLGERTGCARLEEIVGYLCLVKNDPRFQVGRLKPLALYVASISGRQIEANRPIVGEDIFACDTGLHLQGLYNDPQTYEPFAPEKVGGCRRFLLGPKCGRRAIVSRLAGLTGSPATPFSEQAIAAVRQTAQTLRRPLSDLELRDIVFSSGFSLIPGERNHSD